VAVVPKDAAAQTIQQVLQRARENPGKLNYSSSGVATQQHLATELLCAEARVQMTHVPFRGTGQAVNEILAGRIDLALDTLPTYLPHIRNGGVRALAVTMPQRVEWLPEVPTIAESGFPGFDSNVWYMLMGPPGLPAAIQARVAAAVGKALRDPVLGPRVQQAGFIRGGGSPAEAAALLQRDAARYAALIRSAGVTLE